MQSAVISDIRQHYGYYLATCSHVTLITGLPSPIIDHLLTCRANGRDVGVVTWLSGNCSTSGPVSTWMGDRLWAGNAQYAPPTPTRLNCRVELRRRLVGVGGVYLIRN